MNDDLLARLVERVEGRFYGKYRAFVVDNDDPDNRGRVRLQIPSVLGKDVVSGWALPCLPYGGAADQGFFFIPEKDACVWVEFEMGDLAYPVWVGTFWGKPGGETEAPKLNDLDGAEQSEAQSPPTRKIIKTLKGHTIQFEDKDEKEMVMLLEATNGNQIVMNKDGIKITVKTGKDEDEKEMVMLLEATNGNQIVMSKDGIKITDKKGNFIEMTDSAFTIKSKVNFEIDASGQAITIIGKTIDLNKGE
jgi:uncharacterized protein involved in type VI secretion and phage assembly